MQIDIEQYVNDLIERFPEEDHSKVYELFESIEFKLKRNSYHFQNIKEIIQRANKAASDNYYDNIYFPIYYEMEGLLVSLRSSVDILLHFINFSFQLELEAQEVNLYKIYHHPMLPKAIKNIFDRYTRPFDNPTWDFIYKFRNETVHERSINQVLPINVDLFSSKEPLVFFKLKNTDREMEDFFKQCLRFLETFTSQLFHAVRISL